MVGCDQAHDQREEDNLPESPPRSGYGRRTENRDTKDDLGVGRKTRSLRLIMRSAMRAGAQVVYITDQASRGGPDVAAVTLRCRMRGISFYESVVAPVSLITYLCSALALKIGQTAFDRLQFIQEIHDDWGDLVPGDL